MRTKCCASHKLRVPLRLLLAQQDFTNQFLLKAHLISMCATSTPRTYRRAAWEAETEMWRSRNASGTQQTCRRAPRAHLAKPSQAACLDERPPAKSVAPPCQNACSRLLPSLYTSVRLCLSNSLEPAVPIPRSQLPSLLLSAAYWVLKSQPIKP